MFIKPTQWGAGLPGFVPMARARVCKVKMVETRINSRTFRILRLFKHTYLTDQHLINNL